MDIRAEFKQRMLLAAQQFRRELAASGDVDGVLDADAIRATNDAGGVRIAFFEAPATAKRGGKSTKDSAGA